MHDKEAVAPGYWFIGPYEQVHQDRRGHAWVGPHIYDVRGELVWSGAPFFKGYSTYGFTKREVHGEEMLSLSEYYEALSLCVTILS